ncbi:hypothetical protein SAMN05421736_1522 [Evansella caseinilytica]|uniref:Uncharacterized protein n=1 Tax=Evansella caseinilytica TaxID=1503961 RepID=A0A1H3V3L1_9BACI|nr:hypothetical protein [Evansella caseinilytica]SDZ69177.1 hypothetical protein SAMN05421736_1522 [Evansella caseinilytica]
MYRDLDILISAETTLDSWYDDGCIIASEIISEFSIRDWEELARNVHTKPLEWQKKLAYCLDTNCSIHELEMLISLLNTEDEELFEMCIDTLRSFTKTENKQMILENPFIIHRVNELIPKAGVATKRILQDFLINIQS